jgi:hypothetical protein
MISLDDQRWRELKGGYRLTYDASPALRGLEAGNDTWGELWDQLHHQGDVDVASYAAVPHLVRIAKAAERRDWNLYGLVGVIEAERHRKTNPPIPNWLQHDYETALQDLAALALKDLAQTLDASTLHTVLGILALTRGDRKLGTLLLHFDSSEIEELAEERLLWSRLYG